MINLITPVKGTDLKKLNPIEIGSEIERLMSKEGKNVQELMRRFNKSNAWVYIHRQLPRLHPDLQKMVIDKSGGKGRPSPTQKVRKSLNYSIAYRLASLSQADQKMAAESIADCSRHKTIEDVKFYIESLLKGRVKVAKVVSKPQVHVTDEGPDLPPEPPALQELREFEAMAQRMGEHLRMFSVPPDEPRRDLSVMLTHAKPAHRKALLNFLWKLGNKLSEVTAVYAWQG